MEFGIIFSLVGLAIKEREKFLEPTFYGKISDLINELSDDKNGISIEILADFFSSPTIRKFLDDFLKKGISRNYDEFKNELIQFCEIKNISIDVDDFINKVSKNIEEKISKDLLNRVILKYSQDIKSDTKEILTKQEDLEKQVMIWSSKMDAVLQEEKEIFKKIGIDGKGKDTVKEISLEIKQTLDNYEKILDESEKMIHDKKFMKIHTLDELTKRGVYFMHIGNLKKALEIFEIILDVNPKNISALNNKGIILHQYGDYENSLNCYKSAIKENPSISIPYLCAGALLDMLKKYDEALEYYSKAIKLEPNNIITMYNIVHSLKPLERFDEALDWAKKALEIDPKFYLMSIIKGTIHAQLKEYKEARECFEKALESEPDYEIAKKNLESLNEEENTE